MSKFCKKGTTIIPAARPVRSRLPRELLVNKEKFLTGRAAGLSNGVKKEKPTAMLASL